MADAESGRPIFYEALAMRTPVFAASGVELGTVAHVLADEHLDLPHGIVASRAVVVEPSLKGFLHAEALSCRVSGASCRAPTSSTS